MKLFDRLSIALRNAAHDLFGEEDQAPTEASHPDALLDAARRRMEVLTEQLAQAIAREKRAEQAWQSATAQADVIEDEVNTAIRAGDDNEARARLAALKQAQAKAQALAASHHDFAATSEKLRVEIQALQAQLAGARRQIDLLAERDNNATDMEDLQRLRREQRGETVQVHQELAARAESTAQREDRLVAREELDTRRSEERAGKSSAEG